MVEVCGSSPHGRRLLSPNPRGRKLFRASNESSLTRLRMVSRLMIFSLMKNHVPNTVHFWLDYGKICSLMGHWKVSWSRPWLDSSGASVGCYNMKAPKFQNELISSKRIPRRHFRSMHWIMRNRQELQ